MEYIDFLKTKKTAIKKTGFEISDDEMNDAMFDFQKYCVKKALSAGKYALFEDCGLGKTLQQLEWAKKVSEHTNKPVLILAPLGVIRQTICSTRISYTERSSNSRLMPSAKTLSMQDIQSNRLLFRLVPSEHPTGETGCGLLPTVQTQGLKVCNKDGKTEFLNLELLPTPKAQEARGNCSVNRHKFNLTDKIAELTSPISPTFQLNPLFVAEMMGYPLEWLILPFLSHSGEAKASKR